MVISVREYSCSTPWLLPHPALLGGLVTLGLVIQTRRAVHSTSDNMNMRRGQSGHLFSYQGNDYSQIDTIRPLGRKTAYASRIVRPEHKTACARVLPRAEEVGSYELSPERVAANSCKTTPHVV